MPDAAGLVRKHLRDKALALYKPPFYFRLGYIFDADNRMVADDYEDGACLRARGWGRIQYLPNPEQLQDTVGELIAEALTEFWERAQKGGERMAWEAVAAARDVLVAFQKQAGLTPGQDGYSATMTEAEMQLARAVAEIDRLLKGGS